MAQRGGNLDADLAAAAPGFKLLKLWARVPIVIHLDGLSTDGKRGLIVGEKYTATPGAVSTPAGATP